MNRTETIIFMTLILLSCGLIVLSVVRKGCPKQEPLFVPVYVWGRE